MKTCKCISGFYFDDITNPNIPVCKRDCNYDTVHLTGKLK